MPPLDVPPDGGQLVISIDHVCQMLAAVGKHGVADPETAITGPDEQALVTRPVHAAGLAVMVEPGQGRGRELDSEAARDSDREESYASSGMFYHGGFYGSDSFG